MALGARSAATRRRSECDIASYRKTARALNDIWAPVVAAIGASILTGGTAFGLDWKQSRRTQEAERIKRRDSAYANLLARSRPIMEVAGTLRLVVEQRSGIGEGLDIALRHRKLLDHFELQDWLQKYLGPLNDALSEIWLTGSQQTVEKANEVVEKCASLLAVSTKHESSGGAVAKRFSRVAWSDEEVASYLEALGALASARKDFADMVRSEAGYSRVLIWPSGEG